MPNFYDLSAKNIEGTKQALGDFKGQVLLVVNVASKCGLTPHYEGLEAVYNKYKDRGLTVLGFPCNQFAGQEPGTDEEIKEFCSLNFSVDFPLFSKIDVNGDDQDPVYKFLNAATPGPEAAGDITWNFTKFVVGRDGEVVARFDPTTAPDAEPLIAAIEKAL